MQQERIVRFSLWSHTITIARIKVLAIWIPRLRVWRIAHDCIQVQRRSRGAFVTRPVFLQGICIAHIYITWFDTTHHEVHTSKVVCSRFQLLCIIVDIILIVGVFADRLTNIQQERTRTTRRVIDRYVLAVLQVTSNNL